MNASDRLQTRNRCDSLLERAIRRAAYVFVQLLPTEMQLVDLTVDRRQRDFHRLQSLGDLQDLLVVDLRMRLHEAFEILQEQRVSPVRVTRQSVRTSSSSVVSSASTVALDVV